MNYVGFRHLDEENRCAFMCVYCRGISVSVLEKYKQATGETQLTITSRCLQRFNNNKDRHCLTNSAVQIWTINENIKKKLGHSKMVIFLTETEETDRGILLVYII